MIRHTFHDELNPLTQVFHWLCIKHSLPREKDHTHTLTDMMEIHQNTNGLKNCTKCSSRCVNHHRQQLINIITQIISLFHFQWAFPTCKVVCVSTWRQLTERWVDAGASGHAVKPGCDPLGVGAGEQLCGRLAELQNLCQHGDSLVRVLDAARRNRESVTRRDVKYV